MLQKLEYFGGHIRYLLLTEFGGLGSHLRVADQGEEGGLHGRDRGWEGKVGSLGVGLSLTEAVLEDTVDDTANTERRLDDMRDELLFLSDLGLLSESNHLAGKDEFLLASSDGDGLVLSDGGSESFLDIVGSLLEEGHDKGLFLLELLAEDLLVEVGNSVDEGDGLRETTGSHELSLGVLHVLGKIEGGTIGVAGDLNPTVRGLDLSIPTVIGVMSHLGRSMLSEADGGGLDSDGAQELEGSGDEVTNGLVANDSVSDGLTDLHHCGLSFVSILRGGAPERKLDLGDLEELLVRLIVGVNEVLDLSHGELSDTEESLTRRDFITETKANLGGSEGHAAIVELDQSAEVDEDTLGSLGTKVTLHVAGGSDLGAEHEVEGDGLGKRVAGLGILNSHSLDALIDLSLVEVLDILVEGEELFPLVSFLALGKLLLDEFLNELVSSSWSTGLRILDHQVFELFDMTRHLQDITKHETGAANLEHVFLEDEMLSPELLDVVLNGATKGTVIEESSDTVVNLEGWTGEELARHKTLNFLSLVLFGKISHRGDLHNDEVSHNQ